MALMACCALPPGAAAQGRVVINEYLPWPGNGCGVTSEFVELLNFGPGPVDISCYVLTNGKYAITIPPQTILEPGKFYVLAGQDVLPADCGNIAGPTVVDLNWNHCNCTSGPIPSTGEGLMPDGGGANVNLVLLDASFEPVDAVTRQLPVNPSALLTTSSAGGSCNEKEINLDDLQIRYETLGMATGIANSFARKLDGDCGWVKDPQQSAGATNNTSGATSEISYFFDVVQSMDCDGGGGRVSVHVKHSNYGSIFPMNYTLAYDTDKNGSFDFGDSFQYGEDDTPPEIMIDNLPVGDFRVTLASVKGCFLQTFAFRILDCLPALPLQLQGFTLRHDGGRDVFEWTVSGSSGLRSIILEQSRDGMHFEKLTSFTNNGWMGATRFSHHAPGGRIAYARLRLVREDGPVILSQVLRNALPAAMLRVQLLGAAREQLHFSYTSESAMAAPFTVFNMAGMPVLKGATRFAKGSGWGTIETTTLPAGIYLLQWRHGSGNQLFSQQIVKH